MTSPYCHPDCEHLTLLLGPRCTSTGEALDRTWGPGAPIRCAACLTDPPTPDLDTCSPNPSAVAPPPSPFRQPRGLRLRHGWLSASRPLDGPAYTGS